MCIFLFSTQCHISKLSYLRNFKENLDFQLAANSFGVKHKKKPCPKREIHEKRKTPKSTIYPKSIILHALLSALNCKSLTYLFVCVDLWFIFVLQDFLPPLTNLLRNFNEKRDFQGSLFSSKMDCSRHDLGWSVVRHFGPKVTAAFKTCKNTRNE